MVKSSRCAWCGDDPLYVAYHDLEWGVPIGDRDGLFELLVLEGMQAGLSWITVLKKRERMRERFLGFVPERLARQGPDLIEDWLTDAGLIRHRGKLEAMIDNARLCSAMGDRFIELIWSFVDGVPVQNRWKSLNEVPSSTTVSQAMSRGLRAAGFRFVGPTVCYAFMQASGLVNDHLVSCFRHEACRVLGTNWSI